ncbi:hypothetical protein [Haloparvum sedimenti]|uniref:hypothetical protein n=1 Tax=Haloparvum sedimenti TaxID=1678448 RepID=UPI00114617E0|nr:hypothetical protein [Haloparvum sedimenti]
MLTANIQNALDRSPYVGFCVIKRSAVLADNTQKALDRSRALSDISALSGGRDKPRLAALQRAVARWRHRPRR